MVRNQNTTNYSRVTIVLDGDLAKRIRSLQAKKIQRVNSSVSFSSMINDVLRKSLK